MNIILHDDTPAYLTPGGKQTHVEKLYEGLKSLGVNVEYSRWWDHSQKCDLLHLFSPSTDMVKKAHDAGKKVIVTHVMDYLTNQSQLIKWSKCLQTKIMRGCLPKSILEKTSWYFLPQYDALIYIIDADAKTATQVYGAPIEKMSIISHGYDLEKIKCLQRGPYNSRSYLISVANIIPRKNSLLLAKAALQAQIPIMFLGKPLSENNKYFQNFLKVVDNKYVQYAGFVSEDMKIELLKEASGFVLLSNAESGCIAVHEASASGLPLLLSDLPWAHAYGKNEFIQYSSLKNIGLISEQLNSFFSISQRLDHPTFIMTTWQDVAAKYLEVYINTLQEKK
ncbi:MAG: hypothetical protein CVU43_00080 [Chloroflexi bacterium HGW-Chloroflexi-5]|jgi:glycosyltransferase involved in cell wall biosynthesis|nr:MAG: hypothetical protein CVU43_00080 [Chloroflexi bacterium HGW-Chloroflexi-5]